MKITNVNIFLNREESVEVKHNAIWILLPEYDAEKINKLMQEAYEQAATMPEPVYDEEPTESYKERHAKELQEYEATPEGKKYVKRMESTYKEYEKHSNGGEKYGMLMYMIEKHNRDLLEGFSDAYKLGYVAGMKKAKQEAKKK